VQSPAMPMVLHRMTAMREAFRLRRVAHVQRRLWMFYMEHSLLEEARRARSAVLDNLATASRQVRILLGMPVRAPRA